MGQSGSKIGVITWGSSEYGQLGVGKSVVRDKVFNPRLLDVSQLQNINLIAAGGNHCAAVSESGELFVWGRNKEGQLGIGAELKDVVTPKLIKSLQGKYVKFVSCAATHTLVCLDDGCAYSWGDPAHGKLGYSCDEIQTSPKIIPTLQGLHTVFVACGEFHSAFLIFNLNSTPIYTCGLALSGRLGHGGENPDLFEPKPIESLIGYKIVFISCGGHHSACLTIDGELFTWGGGAFGKLGHGSRKIQTIPKKVDGPLIGKNITSVSLGSQHSGCVTSLGLVYTWGQAGRLGLEPRGESDTLIPRQVTTLSGIYAIHASCGHSHTAVVTKNGDVWAWGISRALGHGNNEKLPNVPTCINSLKGKSIVQLDCGTSCYIALSNTKISEEGSYYTKKIEEKMRNLLRKQKYGTSILMSAMEKENVESEEQSENSCQPTILNLASASLPSSNSFSPSYSTASISEMTKMNSGAFNTSTSLPLRMDIDNKQADVDTKRGNKISFDPNFTDINYQGQVLLLAEALYEAINMIKVTNKEKMKDNSDE